MKLKARGVNKAHSVVASNSPDTPCPHIEFDSDDFYDGVVLELDEVKCIIEILELQEQQDHFDDFERTAIFYLRQSLEERYEAALTED